MSLSSADVARLEEGRQAARTAEIACEHERVAGGVMCFGGVGSWMNQASGVGLSGPVDADEVERLVEFFASRGVEPRVEVTPFVDQGLLAVLADRGFVVREFEMVLARALDPTEDLRALHPHGWPPGLELEHVDPRDPDAVERYVVHMLGGFFPEGAPPPETYAASVRSIVGQDGFDAFVARLDGRRVGGGGVDVVGESAALCGASVARAARRRGVQLALILARLERAAARGARLACITSAPDVETERNARRVGFEVAYTKTILVRPGEGLVPTP